MTINNIQDFYFKDELKGKIMSKFISLRPKLYSYIVCGVQYKKAKGVKKYVIKQHLKFEHYANILDSFIKGITVDSRITNPKMNLIQSNKHKVFSKNC